MNEALVLLALSANAFAILPALATIITPRLASQDHKPFTLPIIPSLKSRDIIGANGQEGSGISPVAMASDRQ